MKIVRVTIGAGQSRFFFDRSYDQSLTDQVNTDNALSFLTEMCEQRKTLAVMLMGQGAQVVEGDKKRHDPFNGAIPALLNLSIIQMIVIEGVGIYTLEEPTIDE